MNLEKYLYYFQSFPGDRARFIYQCSHSGTSCRAQIACVTSSGNRCIEHLGSWTLMAKALRIETHLPRPMHIDTHTHTRTCECAHTLNAHASVMMCGPMPQEWWVEGPSLNILDGMRSQLPYMTLRTRCHMEAWIQLFSFSRNMEAQNRPSNFLN